MLPNLVKLNKTQVLEDKKVDTTDIKSPIINPNEQIEKEATYPPTIKQNPPTIKRNQSTIKLNQEGKEESVKLPIISKNIPEKLFNDKFKGTLAIVDIESKNGMSNILSDLLNDKKIKATTSFFRSDFFKRYRTIFWQKGIEVLDEISIPKNLRCICLVKENVKYETEERLGQEFTTVKGEVELKILRLVDEVETTLIIPVGGAGAGNRRAYESFQSNFIKEFGINSHLMKFESCKK